MIKSKINLELCDNIDKHLWIDIWHTKHVWEVVGIYSWLVLNIYRNEKYAN